MDGVPAQIKMFDPKSFSGASLVPQFVCGDAREVLANLPDRSIDFCMTSPPYWGHRQYSHGGIGLEDRYQQYVDDLCAVFAEVHRVLMDSGSFWLNLGDTYFE